MKERQISGLHGENGFQRVRGAGTATPEVQRGGGAGGGEQPSAGDDVTKRKGAAAARGGASARDDVTDGRHLQRTEAGPPPAVASQEAGPRPS